MNVYNTNNWIERAKKVHGDKYDYSKTKYTKAKDKVTIICHCKDKFGFEHGEFEVRACNHLNGTGCPKCGGKYTPTTEEWIERARKVHGDKYDYSKVKYTKNNEKICIICPTHGEFYQRASSHLLGIGCPMCHGGVASNLEKFIREANFIHKNKYDYTSFQYINAKTHGLITCKKHGNFLQTPEAHLRGEGCPKCKHSYLEKLVMDKLNEEGLNYIFQYKINNQFTDFFLEEYNLVIECQGEQHFYPTDFSGKNDKVIANKNFENNLIRDCKKFTSLKQKDIDVIYFTDKNYFRNKEIDVNIDFYQDKQLFTNIDDLFTYIRHRKKVKKIVTSFDNLFEIVWNKVDKNAIKYNRNVIKINNVIIVFQPIEANDKQTLNTIKHQFEKSGHKVIVIMEDEFLYKKEIVIEKINHIIGIDKEKNKIYGRKCQIREVSIDEAKTFLDKFHIQGFVSSTVYLGAFYNDDLIGVMNFKKISDEWELTRFASDYNYICCGVGGKLLNYFIKKYNPLIIKSFADRRWTLDINNNIYTKLGFVIDKKLKPDYRYFNIRVCSKQRLHKFNFRKESINKRYGLPLTMTEKEMARELGYDRVYDCGLVKYIWRK